MSTFSELTEHMLTPRGRSNLLDIKIVVNLTERDQLSSEQSLQLLKLGIKSHNFFDNQGIGKLGISIEKSLIELNIDKNIFYSYETCNRGPLLLDKEKLSTSNPSFIFILLVVLSQPSIKKLFKSSLTLVLAPNIK